jgi:predicted O-methyltransferase YrrM
MKVLIHFGLWSVGLKNAETQTTVGERDCLARHAAGKKRLAEVGVWHGVTTCRLRQAMASNAMLFAIDPYPRGRLGFSAQRIIAHKEVSGVSNGTVTWIRDTGANAVTILRGTEFFDFVFIDGDHSYEGLQADWTGWSSLLAPAGIIALHDSRSTPERPIDNAGSVQFTRKVILPDTQFEVIETVDSLTVLRRNGR